MDGDAGRDLLNRSLSMLPLKKEITSLATGPRAHPGILKRPITPQRDCGSLVGCVDLVGKRGNNKQNGSMCRILWLELGRRKPMYWAVGSPLGKKRKGRICIKKCAPHRIAVGRVWVVRVLVGGGGSTRKVSI